MRIVRLEGEGFYVDVRLKRVHRRWLASADTPNGPSLGWGTSTFEALWMALEPFDGVIDQLLACLPSELAEH